MTEKHTESSVFYLCHDSCEMAPDSIAVLEGCSGSDQPEESYSPKSQHSSTTSGSSERNGLSTDDLHSDADWGDVLQTNRLDCSVYRAKARLAQGLKRKRPSRNKQREPTGSLHAPRQSKESVCMQNNKPERTNSERRRSYLESFSIHVPLLQSRHDQICEQRIHGGPDLSTYLSIQSQTLQAANSLSTPKVSSTPQSPSSQSSSSLLLNLRDRRNKSKEHSKITTGKDEESDGSSTRKPKQRFPDFSRIRRSGGKSKKRDCTRGSVGSSGSGNLLDESSSSVSPPGSISSIPSCMPFSWFGDREKEKERERKKERSASSSSLSRTPSDGYLEARQARTNKGLNDRPAPLEKQYTWQNRPVSEWTNKQICHWLMIINMEQYLAEFTAKNVDGQQLLFMNSSKLKELGVSSHRHRSTIKKRLKDIKKAQDKLEKQRKKKEKESGREKEVSNEANKMANFESAC